MKKMVALACAGLMVASVVTGCGSKKDDADKSGGEKRVLKFDSFSVVTERKYGRIWKQHLKRNTQK